MPKLLRYEVQVDLLDRGWRGEPCQVPHGAQMRNVEPPGVVADDHVRLAEHVVGALLPVVGLVVLGKEVDGAGPTPLHAHSARTVRFDDLAEADVLVSDSPGLD